MDGRVLEDQQITTYGIHYSSILSITYSLTFTWVLCDFKAFYLKGISPREQLSYKPVWHESTYWWNTDNCSLTSVSNFDNSKLNIIAA